MDVRKGTAIAAAVAGMLCVTGCGDDDKDDVSGATEALKCEGGNECAGKSECASAQGKNDCHGMNECAGMGWVTVDSEKECTELGGKIIREEAES